jgi:hypothetical protein
LPEGRDGYHSNVFIYPCPSFCLLFCLFLAGKDISGRSVVVSRDFLHLKKIGSTEKYGWALLVFNKVSCESVSYVLQEYFKEDKHLLQHVFIFAPTSMVILSLIHEDEGSTFL